MKNKTILVTGGAGFIGSHLCERLVKDNTVISLDNYFTGSTKNHIEGVTYIVGDCSEINTKCKNIFPDYVYHLGEYSRVEQSFEDVNKVLTYNMTGIKEVLKYTLEKDAKIIYAGSSTKYADLGKNASPYTWSKATNTELVQNFGEWFNLDYAITYFYNVYGPREIEDGKYSTLIAKFKNKIKKGESLTVVSPGTQRRNFTHIDDTIDALILVGLNGHGDEHGIGATESYSVLEIAEMFTGIIEMLPERRGNRTSAPVLTDKITKLGWTQKRKLKDYINKIRKD